MENFQSRGPEKGCRDHLESCSLLPHMKKIEEIGGEVLPSELVPERNKTERSFLHRGHFCTLWHFRTLELNLVLDTAA